MSGAAVSLSLAVACLDPFPDDLPGNVVRAAAAIHRAGAAGADLVCLPELSLFPWFVDEAPDAWRARMPTLDEPLLDPLAEATAREGIHAVVPLPIRRQDGVVVNAALVLGPDGRRVDIEAAGGRTLPCAEKMHVPPARHDGFGERAHFVPGRGLGVFRVRGVTIGILICFDRRFPECWRALRRLGADLVVVPVAGPGNDPPGFFEAELRTHAKENRVFALASARHGVETRHGRTVSHDGGSCLLDPDGAVVARFEGPEPEPVAVDLDAVRAARARLDFAALVRADL